MRPSIDRARSPSEGIRAGRRDLSPEKRAAYVRRMFSAVAPRYDLTNTVISAGLHRRWKRATVAALGLQPGERVLDLCCGTGDLARLMTQAVGADGMVTAVDFAPPMIAEARRRSGGTAAFLVGDAMAAPFADASFDAAAVGFGLRNVADPDRTLEEIRRVLRPGGTFVAVTNGDDSLADLRKEAGAKRVVTGFSSENGEFTLSRRFSDVRRQDLETRAVFADHASAQAYLDSSDEGLVLPHFDGERTYAGHVTVFEAR